MVLPNTFRHIDVSGAVGVISALEPPGLLSGLNAFVLQLGVPVVDLGLNEPQLSLPRVLLDYKAAGKLAAEQFVAHGVRNLHYMGWCGGRWHDDLRIDGYQQAARAAGLKVHVTAFADAGSPVSEHIDRALAQMALPAGVFCSYDRVAADVLRAVKKRGLRVPQDVELIGGQHSEVDSAYTDPPLTSIDLNLEQQGFTAAELLHALVCKHPHTPDRVVVPGISLVERHTTYREQPEMREALQYIERNLGTDLSLDDVCRAAAASRSTLQRRFKQYLGHGVMTEVKLRRVEKAKRLLLQTTWSATEIAGKVGYETAAHFYRTFKEVEGISTGQFRKRSREQQS